MSKLAIGEKSAQKGMLIHSNRDELRQDLLSYRKRDQRSNRPKRNSKLNSNRSRVADLGRAAQLPSVV